MKFSHYAAVAIALIFSTIAGAEVEPDINFGQWENRSTTTIEMAQFSMPPNTVSSVDCVTKEDFEEGRAFMSEMEDCSLISEDIRSDGADFNMVCNQPEMGELTLNMSMNFAGDSMSGRITGEMDGPMGPTTIRIDIAGERIGDCP